MKFEKSKVNVTLTEKEKEAYNFIAHETTVQCGGIDCSDCPFDILKHPTHSCCIVQELASLAIDLLNITEGSK